MALIKCPECDNKISDKAITCPKCGYELKKEKPNIKLNIPQNKNFTYLVIALIVVIGGLLIYNGYNKKTTTPNENPLTPSSNGYSIYKDSYLGISFEIPSDYKVTKDNEGFIYVGKNIDNKGALIPYIIIGRYDNFNNEVQFLNSFTNYMKQQTSDLKIIIDLVSGVIGNKTVYGLAYSYTSSNHLVIDNRYATVINNKVYMVGSKEENTNTAEINNVVDHILSTLTEGGV